VNLTNSKVVLLTLHNTRSNQSYVVWSSTNLSLTNWIVETNLTGAAGDFTVAIIPKNERTNLFLRASESRNYSTDTNYTFTGLAFTNGTVEPPDSMGAVGPSHFLEVINGASNSLSSVAVYDKSGGLVASARSVDFFALTNAGTNYPIGQFVF